ncbi:hypothetical protein D3C79_510080 [compost metagenome]
MQPVGGLLEVRSRVVGGADSGACPEDVKTLVQPLAQIRQIVGGHGAEHLLQHRIRRVVAGAEDETAGAGVGGDVVGDGELPVGEIRGIPLHVVKQHRQYVGLERLLDEAHLLEQGRALVGVVVMGAHGAQAHPEGEAVVAALLGQLAQVGELFLRPGLGPVLAQIAVFLGGIEVEAIAMAGQPLGVAGAGLPAPALAEEALDQPQSGRGRIQTRQQGLIRHGSLPSRRAPVHRLGGNGRRVCVLNRVRLAS